ncbi:MAG: 1,4-alpha-glucan branching protein GlgB [Thermodesulfobacteriota bacterium]
MPIDVMRELERVIQADQHDPFTVLGFHRIEEQPPSAVIRTFQPQAVAVKLVAGGERKYLYKMREEGLFEIIIPNCHEVFDYLFEITTYDGTVRTCRDPYRFLPQLSEFDAHLIKQGTQYQLHEKLGAHVVTVDNITGTLFRVWVPGARRVSVVGNFNYWDGRVHQMRCLGDSGIWELFIPGVGQGEHYKFEIRTQSMAILEKADPVQFFGELRPKSASIVWKLDDYEWSDQEWQREKAASLPYAAPMAIYEVHLGSWKRDPGDPHRFLTYEEMANRLVPYVKRLGFTHIQLMPVMEHPLDESWGYQVTGYFSATSRYGTPEELMYLVDVCHQNGIGVIMDWVPAHFPADGHSLATFNGQALYEHQDPRQGFHPEWGTHIFNFGRYEVANFLIASALFWLERYHMDGLRVDAVASMLYLDYAREEGDWVPNCYGGKENIEAIEFLRHLNSVVYQRHPHALMIAEESTSFFGVSKPTEVGGLGFGFKWNLGWMNDTLTYFSKDPIYRKYHHNALTFPLLYAFTENFILVLSHDEVVHGKRSLLSKMPGDTWQQFANLRLLFLFMWASPGKKLLFMGGEMGQVDEWYCKKSLDWHLLEEDGPHRRLQSFVRELNALYRAHPCLWELDFDHHGFSWMDFLDVDRSVVSFARFAKDRQDHLVVLLNFTPEVHHDYRLGVPELVNYREILCSDNECFGGATVCNPHEKVPFDEPFGQAPYHVKVSVPPLGGIVLAPVRD